MAMRTEEEMSQEDLDRVNQYLATGYNRVQRKPARLWLLLGIVWLVIGGLGLVSFLIARNYNVI